jgi:ParB family chromosome partitioning protein
LKKEAKRPLGRGLKALIGQAAREAPAAGAAGAGWEAPELPVDSIIRSKSQPRIEMSDAGIQELADSIVQHGLLQPVVVRPPDSRGKHRLIAGERRWLAAQKAELKSIPALVRDVDDKTALGLALVENLQREDLTPLECARAYQTLAEGYGLTQDEIADELGKSRPAIANALRLLNLPDEVQKALHEGRISEGHARAILSIDGVENQMLAFEMIVQQGLSVRKAESLAKTLKKRKVSRETKAAEEDERDPNLIQLENALQMHFGTKVAIRRTPKKGLIEIEFYTDEDLERILTLLRGPRG